MADGTFGWGYVAGAVLSVVFVFGCVAVAYVVLRVLGDVARRNGWID